MSNQKKRKVTDQGNEDLTSDHSSAMGNPRVRSKARRTTTTNAFEQEMMRRKNDEFQDLNRNFAVAVRNFHIPAAPADDKPVSMLDLLNEYIRMALLIERRFGGVPCDVVAMGDDDMFQLGLDPDIKRDDDVMTVSPTLITRLGQTIRMVGAGGLHSLALSTTGVPYSWGVSDEGTLGRMADDDELAQKTPLPIKGFVRIDGVKEDGQIVQISAGASHNLFLSMSGAVYQCGMYKDMDSGKFSDKDGPSGTTEGCNKKPMHVFQMPGKVRSICTNGSVNAALMEDSTVLTWGFGNKGELARSAGMTTPGPNGQYELGKLYCYKSVGEGEAQELVPDLEIVDNHFLKPKPVLWATNPQVKRTAIAVAVGTFHILVSARDPGQYQAKLYTSGLNNYGQLGHGDSGDNTERHALTLVRLQRLSE